MISQLLAFLFAGINATKFYKHTGENVGTFHQRPRDSYNKLSQQPHEGQGYQLPLTMEETIFSNRMQ